MIDCANNSFPIFVAYIGWMESVSRKCSHCGEWNGNQDFCTQCGKPLSPAEVRKEELKKWKPMWVRTEPTAIDLFLERIKQSRNPVVKLIYYAMYSIWVAYLAILSFFMFLVAITPG